MGQFGTQILGIVNLRLTDPRLYLRISTDARLPGTSLSRHLEPTRKRCLPEHTDERGEPLSIARQRMRWTQGIPRHTFERTHHTEWYQDPYDNL
jgi:hypothetical protein